MTDKPERPGDRMDAVLGMVDLTPTERLVLAKHAFHDGDGGARWSAGKIANHIGISRAQYFDHIKSIEGKGRAKRRRGKTTSTVEIRYQHAPHCREFPDSLEPVDNSHSVRKFPARLSGNSRHEPEEPEVTSGGLTAKPQAARSIPPPLDAPVTVPVAACANGDRDAARLGAGHDPVADASPDIEESEMYGQHTDPATALAMALAEIPGRGNPARLHDNAETAAAFIATEDGSAAAALWRVDRDTDGLLTAWREASRLAMDLSSEEIENLAKRTEP